MTDTLVDPLNKLYRTSETVGTIKGSFADARLTALSALVHHFRSFIEDDTNNIHTIGCHLGQVSFNDSDGNFIPVNTARDDYALLSEVMEDFVDFFGNLTMMVTGRNPCLL